MDKYIMMNIEQVLIILPGFMNRLSMKLFSTLNDALHANNITICSLLMPFFISCRPIVDLRPINPKHENNNHSVARLYV